MSVDKMAVAILMEVTELEKVALSLKRDETLERFSCKRCIKQNNMTAAAIKAKRCIELRKQSQAYFSLCQRVRIFIDLVNLAVVKQDKANRDLIHIVHTLEDAIHTKNIGLIELYLDNFEKNYSEEMKERLKEMQAISYIEAFRGVTQNEIDKFLCEISHEAKEDEKKFMFKKYFVSKKKS